MSWHRGLNLKNVCMFNGLSHLFKLQKKVTITSQNIIIIVTPLHMGEKKIQEKIPPEK